MDRLLQTFETPFTSANGDVYDVQIYGRSRPRETWKAWLVFLRRRDGRRIATGTETTQPSAEAVVYWATGLTPTYLEGAFERAERLLSRPRRGRRDTSTPEVTSYGRHREDLERMILRLFRKHETTRLPVEVVLNELPHAHADVVRAFEDLEKRQALLVRRTEMGTDWVSLTEAGARVAGFGDTEPRTAASQER